MCFFFFLEELILHFFRFGFTLNVQRHRNWVTRIEADERKKEEEDTNQATSHEHFPHATTSSISTTPIHFG